MDVDVSILYAFFKTPVQTMPKVMLDLVLEGHVLRSGQLETLAMDWRSLREDFGSEIANKVEVLRQGESVPLVYDKGNSHFFVYHPINGKYLGRCEEKKE